MSGTALHETLHALGFIHEHSRTDRDNALLVKKTGDHNFEIEHDSKCITPFDPFSVMLYNESEIIKRKGDYNIWKLKKSSKQSNHLSELDKVALNIAYKPCVVHIGPDDKQYNPKLGKTGLYYCGRKVMKRHNYPADDMTDGYCGPNSGPNCHACRVLKTKKMDKLNKEQKFQGYSGYIYCGQWMGVIEPGHDGYCGPDNGTPCDHCYSEIMS